MLSLARPWGHAVPWGLREREACEQAEPGLSLYRPLLRKPSIALRAKERGSVRSSVHYGKSRYQTGNELVIGIHPKAWSCGGILLEGALVREKALRQPRAGRKQTQPEARRQNAHPSDAGPNSQPPWAETGLGNAQLRGHCHYPHFTVRIRDLPRSHMTWLCPAEPPSPGAFLREQQPEGAGAVGELEQRLLQTRKRSIPRSPNGNALLLAISANLPLLAQEREGEK